MARRQGPARHRDLGLTRGPPIRRPRPSRRTAAEGFLGFRTPLLTLG
jgi:hypothetical protein